MTGKIAERLSVYGSNLKERVIKRCPYKDKHFCNGEPNVPAFGRREEIASKKACKYFRGGKCRNEDVCIRNIVARESEGSRE